MSVGRRWGVGFAADRRLNVAFSRFKKRVVILLNNKEGIHNPFWNAFRQFTGRMGALIDVGVLDFDSPSFRTDVETASAKVTDLLVKHRILTPVEVRFIAAQLDMSPYFDE